MTQKWLFRVRKFLSSLLLGLLCGGPRKSLFCHFWAAFWIFGGLGGSWRSAFSQKQGAKKSTPNPRKNSNQRPLPFLQPPHKHRNRDTTRHFMTLFFFALFENMLLLPLSLFFLCHMTCYPTVSCCLSSRTLSAHFQLAATLVLLFNRWLNQTSLQSLLHCLRHENMLLLVAT